MKVKCPLCGQGEISAVEGKSVQALDKPGHPAPHELYAMTGGGQAYINAMIEHGYVVRAG